MSMTPEQDHDDHPTPAAVRDTHDDTPEVTSTEERSRLATHPDPTLSGEAGEVTRDPRARVEFVRLPELATRGAGRTLAYGHELNRKLAGIVKETIREERDTLRQRLSARDAEISVTGPEHATTRAIGREGVSR